MKNVEFEVPDDWRGTVTMRVRKLIKQADPEIIEDVKWKTRTNPNGVLVWYRDGMLLTGEIYKKHLRFSFAKGPALKEFDSNGLINSYRAAVITEETKLDETGFKTLIREAVKLNQKPK